MNLKRILFLFLLALVLTLAAGCQGSPEETTEPEPTEPPIEQITGVVTEENIHLLDQYPDLKILDLSGSTCYEAIAKYIASHPHVDVTYTVTLGSTTVSNKATALVLDPGTCDYDTLAKNLAFLPMVETVSMPRTTYTATELTALEGLYPDIKWDYTVILLGQELTAETTALNLSVLESERVTEAAQIISLFPGITNVELSDSYGNSILTVEDVKLLQESAPDIVFHYCFELFGKTVCTTDERIEYVDQPIGNEGETELRRALEILKSCTYLLLDNCGFDNEVLASVREDYRDRTKIVWRISLDKAGRKTYLTDTDTIFAVSSLSDENSEPLKYCEDAKYLYLTNNAALSDISFVASMPELEIVLLSGAPIKDLTPFADHSKLIYLEVAHCIYLQDISPLESCTALEHINISYTKVTDISVLKSMPLKQLCAVQTTVAESDQKELAELLPACAIRFDGTQAYGTGWRYKVNGAYTDIYARIREIFELDAFERQQAEDAQKNNT